MKRTERCLLGCAAALLSGAASAEVPVADAGFGAVGLRDCRTDLRHLNQLFGWQVSWPRDWFALRSASATDVRKAIDFWRGAAGAIRAAESSLANSGTGETAPRVIVERVLPQIDALASDLDRGPPPLGPQLPPALQSEWEQLFTKSIRPAIGHYRDFLRQDYLAKASPAAGLSGTREGARCFRQSVKEFSTIDLEPAEIEQIGWRLLRDAQADLMKLHGISRARLPQLLETLRNHREEGFSSAQLIAVSQAAIARATAAMPLMFHPPVMRTVTVKPMPEHMQASFAAGFYVPTSEAGEATYVINLSRADQRRLMAEVLAFHEALPGHHVRDALGYPAGTFNSGFGEGWALYSEYLADEFGLYASKIDRSGMMAKHLWAASRLIVEPGLHVRGWSRAQAIAFMHQHTSLPLAEIEVEVDRYIATPGQSVSYMLGYDRIADARRYARQRLGPAFDVRDFHQQVLGKGARPLDQVHTDVVAWANESHAVTPTD